MPAGGRAPWPVIDPKPPAGDPGVDLLPAIVDNFLAEEVRWRFDLLTEAFGADRGRPRAWTTGRVLQNCLWDVQEGEVRLDGDRSAVAEPLPGRWDRPARQGTP